MRRLMMMAAALSLLAGGACAAGHEVRMVTGEDGTMQFEPDFIRASPGDTIRFIPVDPTHNAETIRGMLPDGAEAFKGEISEDFTVTLTEEGVYGIVCKSHYAVGMVMLAVVGEPKNLEQASKWPHPKKAREIFEKYLKTLPAD